MSHHIFYQGDSLKVLRKLDSQSVQCCVTSPPYWSLRDYGVEGQLGLEKTPEEYVAKMVEVFREVRRVLRDDGTLWLNLGDCYMSNPNPDNGDPKNMEGRKRINNPNRQKIPGLKTKDLVGIPWMVAFVLRDDGWYLRQEIIWHKPNAMPESVTDRPTRAHETIFLLSKSQRYYYDAEAIKEPAKDSSIKRLNQDIDSQQGSIRGNGGSKTMKAVRFGGNKKNGGTTYSGKAWTPSMDGGAKGIDERKHGAYIRVNKRSVWSVATANFKEAHFATFPPKLIEPCILAGCPKGGVVLDPFGGSGTTNMVAKKHGRSSIYIDLNPEYLQMAINRMDFQTLELFDEHTFEKEVLS